jgi:hypothetical protein
MASCRQNVSVSPFCVQVKNGGGAFSRATQGGPLLLKSIPNYMPIHTAIIVHTQFLSPVHVTIIFRPHSFSLHFPLNSHSLSNA